MEEAQRIGAHDAIGVVHEIGVEAAVIHAVAEYGAVRGDGDDAAAVLHDLHERHGSR